MIDPDAGVALEGIAPVMPESVDPLVGMEVPDRVGPALSDELAIFFTRFRSEQGVLRPALRLVDVYLGWNDIIITDEDCRQLAVEQVLRVLFQPVEPGEFVVELRSRFRIAVGRIHVADEP